MFRYGKPKPLNLPFHLVLFGSIPIFQKTERVGTKPAESFVLPPYDYGMAYSPEIRQAARSLYLKSWTPKDIATELNLNNERVVYFWADKYGWRDMLREYTVEDAITHQILALLEIEEPTKAQLDKLDRLIAHDVKLKKMRIDNEAKQNREQQAPKASAAHDSGTRSSEGNSKKRKGKGKKNDISELTDESFQEFRDSLFEYQHTMRANKHQRIRNILKSRQIGATYYFAFEAFEDAVLTGDNQIFLSASRAQAEVFRSYITNIAKEWLNLDLTGNPIVLSNGAELRFLSTNSKTAQSYHGHVYVDEYFWIPKFDELNKLASAMATHKKWRKTYFSTPSAKTHQAYPFWTGDQWRQGRDSRANVEFPTFAEYRDGGRLCPDKQWRYVVTIEDAAAGGCDLFDIEELRDEYSKDDFDNLFMCVFVDGSLSVFKFSKLEQAMCDSSHWTDFDINGARPFGHREVWLGFDPSRTRDNACLVVVAPPIVAVEKFRILEKHYWKGLNFQYQAAQVDKVFDKYNVTYCGIDITGIGAGVFELINKKHPREARAIHYSQENKNRLVMKMIDVVDENRLSFDAEHKDLAMAFMAIKRVTTASGNALTFKAERSDVTGHADGFWAIAHAIINEPLDYKNQRKSTWS